MFIVFHLCIEKMFLIITGSGLSKFFWLNPWSPWSCWAEDGWETQLGGHLLGTEKAGAQESQLPRR